MPQRFLRPGITTSDGWNSVPWECQSFYVRLLTLVDDFGRYDGRASVLWGQCFAVWNDQNPDDSVDLLHVAQMLQQLAASSLIDIYQVENKPVRQITKWQERLRAGVKERWPIPSGSPKIAEVAASCSKLLRSSSPSPSPSSPASPNMGLQQVAANEPEKPKRVQFQKPTEDEVNLRAAKIGLPKIEAEKFYAYYNSNGWRVGRNPMRSWVSALSNWNLNWRSRGYSAQVGNRPLTGAEQRNVGIPETKRHDLATLLAGQPKPA